MLFRSYDPRLDASPRGFPSRAWGLASSGVLRSAQDASASTLAAMRQIRDAVRNCRAGRDCAGAILTGPNGVAKTSLLARVALAESRAGHPIRYLSGVALTLEILTRDDAEDAVHDLQFFGRHRGLVVVDEADKCAGARQYGQSHCLEFLRALVHARADAEAPTLLAGNLTREHAATVLGADILDRLAWIEMAGASHRGIDDPSI